MGSVSRTSLVYEPFALLQYGLFVWFHRKSFQQLQDLQKIMESAAKSCKLQ